MENYSISPIIEPKDGISFDLLLTNVDKSTCVDPDTRVGADWRYKASGKTQRGNNISLNGYYQDTCANAIQNCRNASSDIIDATCSIRCSG